MRSSTAWTAWRAASAPDRSSRRSTETTSGLPTSGATISVAPTAWATAGARSDWTIRSPRADASMTTGIVALGVLILGILHAQGAGELGLTLGPGGVERLCRLAGAEVDRLPG